jgi:sulfur-oxidizing protein SoxZ
MATKTIKARAKVKGDICTVKALIKHPMETGLRKDKKTGDKIPAHFIQEVKCDHNNETVMNAYWGGSVSKNPYISFSFTGASKGDTIMISWIDNKDDSDSIETKIK